jgi:hypothetical protein
MATDVGRRMLPGDGPSDTAGPERIDKEAPLDLQIALELVNARIAELHRHAARERLAATAQRTTERPRGGAVLVHPRSPPPTRSLHPA